MSYENDDLRPRPPKKRVPATVKAEDEKPSVEIVQPKVSKGSPMFATRGGDDDLRPNRPSEEVLKQRAQARASSDLQKQSDSNVSSTNTESTDETVCVDTDFGLLKLMLHICVAVVAIWVLGSLGSLLHSIAVSATVMEMSLFVLIFVVEVSLVLYVVYYTRKTFSVLPEVTQLHKKKYAGDLQTLAAKLKSDYIRQFPDQEVYAKLAGFNQDTSALRLLGRLRDHRYADSVGFMDDYDRFQKEQDERALEIIKTYSQIIGIKTAACPWKAVDIITVFFNSTLMVMKIANVYQRRVSRQQAFRLVLRWFTNLYVSGEIGQIAEGAATATVNGAFEWFGNDGISAVLRPLAPLLSKFGGKMAEGGLNAFLAYRLGSRACESFRGLVE